MYIDCIKPINSYIFGSNPGKGLLSYILLIFKIINILWLEADLPMSFWFLTSGRGLHTVHKCVVFTVFSVFTL